MIVSAVVILILTILYITLVKRKTNENKERIAVKLVKSIVIALCAFSAVDLALLIWRIAVRLQLQKLFNSMAYYELVESSFDEAYGKIASYNNTLKEIIILSVILVALVVFVFLFSRLLKKLKNLKPKPKKEKTNRKPPEITNVPISEKAPQLQEEQPIDTNKVFFCPQCGEKHDSKPKFCGRCGYRIE